MSNVKLTESFELNDYTYFIKKREEINLNNMFEFCEIPDFPRYYINGFGNVYSEKSKKFIKHILNVSNQYSVCVQDGKSQKTRAIHILMAKTFIPNPENHKYVLIKDKALPLRVSNLYWSEKLNHSAPRIQH